MTGSGKSRIAGFVFGATICVGGYFVVRSSPSLLALILIAAAIGGVSLVMLYQPGTYLYATAGMVGTRTVFGTRYEVPSSRVATIGIVDTTFQGVPCRAVAIRASDGQVLLTHYNANFGVKDLRMLAQRAGASLELGDDDSST